MNLIIVESPTKAKTIGRFLSSDYKLESCYGHIRDLPKSKLGIDIENNFEPQYVIPTKSRKRVNSLKKEVRQADKIILGTDVDREGEAIAFHLIQALELNEEQISKVQRIVFHEITKEAIEKALKNPCEINMSLVDAQQARRILDRLVGYKLSPFLWEKVVKRLSAGRVQSVAVRLIVERENEIKIFNSEEYWTVEAEFQRNEKHFIAKLIKKDGKIIPKIGIKTKEEAEKIVRDLKNAEYKIISIEKKEVKKNPLPPFITSTLQQESWKKLHFPAKFTMGLAQGLYEKGLCTYHRTDSCSLSEQGLILAKKIIEEKFGKNYWAGFRRFKTKSRLAQEAHEAVRPTQPGLTPQNLNENEEKLYDLIWRRFISSQMPPAIFDSTSVEIEANKYIFKATGQTLRFDGFLKVYQMNFQKTELPALEKGEILDLVKLIPSQHFTLPPARYNDASLIKALEAYGIGRPSTYASIISVIQERNYVEKLKGQFQPTEMGEIVNKILVEHFPKIVDIEFTAEMEKKLDEIAQDKRQWQEIIRNFYEPFSENLEKKYQQVEKQLIEQKTDIKCETCGKPMNIKFGRFGKFLACSGFPECKNTKSIEESFGLCPKCKQGNIVKRRTKKRRYFFGCSKYPNCDWAVWKLEQKKASQLTYPVR